MSKKTPKKKGRKSESGCEGIVDISSQFSPAPVSPLVRASPASSGGRLTGLPRKVKDTCADWHNCIMEWDSLNAKGMQYASNIANSKIQTGSGNTTEEGDTAVDLSTVFPPGLDVICQQLKTIYVAMERIVNKFETFTSNLRGVAALEKSQLEQSFSGCTSNEPLFNTWSTDMFYETSQKLLEMYRDELDVKKSVVENIAHAPDRNTLMMYTAVWLHQPYIDNTELLESLLAETGLK